MRMTSTKSMIPLKSSSSNCSLVSLSTCTVMAEYGFLWQVRQSPEHEMRQFVARKLILACLLGFRVTTDCTY
jgi:hypothetical protein